MKKYEEIKPIPSGVKNVPIKTVRALKRQKSKSERLKNKAVIIAHLQGNTDRADRLDIGRLSFGWYW